ncbi:MAG TPA: hypothetical protein VNH11_13725 [Pirellulales bacterium]|nr:hypothetical protein [Pirellulales bacterium]
MNANPSIYQPPRVVSAVGLGFLAVFAGPVAAAAPVAIRDRAVDRVALVGGEQILGMFAAPPADGTVTLYVRRQWLKKHQPALYRKTAAGEDDRRKQALEEYLQRLKTWRERRPEPKLLNDFIERSIRDVESRLQGAGDQDAEAGPSQLMVVEVLAIKVKRHDVQPTAVRRLLGLAWQARLDDAEDLSAAALAEKLKEQAVDVEHAVPDLSDRFDIVPLDDRQWAAKVALIEFEILVQPHFQGTGGMLVRDDGDGGNRPPLADLIGGMLQDQLGDALGDLLNPQPGGAGDGGATKQRKAANEALASAAEEKATGVRITYLDQDIANRRVTVTDTFYALMPGNAWEAIWRQSSTAGIDVAKEMNEDELAADPQVAEVSKTLKGLGIDANNELFKSALRFGGATQKAVQDSDRAFTEYLLSHTRRLIGPPVPLPSAAR